MAYRILEEKFTKDTVLEQEEFTRLAWIHHPQGRPMETRKNSFTEVFVGLRPRQGHFP